MIEFLAGLYLADMLSGPRVIRIRVTEKKDTQAPVLQLLGRHKETLSDTLNDIFY